MKNNKFIRHAGLFTIACISLCACSEDENQSSIGDGTPIRFTASIKAPATRIIDSDTGSQWETTDKIAISLDGSSTYKTYTIGSDNQITSEDPYSWDGNQHSVKAWSPILTEAKDITDQSDNTKFSACDFVACETTINSKEVKLQFSHTMTRAWYEVQVVDENLYTNEDVSNATVEFFGYPQAKFNNGTLTGEGEITTIATKKMLDDFGVFRRGEAFLVPTEMWNKPLIKVTIGGNSYTYTPSNDDPESEDVKKKRGVLEAGKWQRYYLKLKETGLEVTMMSSVGWGTKEDISSDDIENGKFHATVSSDLSGKADYASTNIENGNINGETFTITYTENGSGGITHNGKCDVIRTTEGTSHTYTFSNIRSDISLSYVDEYVAVGDYFYSDGTWGSDFKDGQTVGVVFKVGVGNGDNPENYGYTKIRGYVVATTNVTLDHYQWIINSAGDNNPAAQLLKDLDEFEGERGNNELYNGYNLTDKVFEKIGNEEETLANVPFINIFKNNWSTKVGNYSWYIPSIAQVIDIARSGVVHVSDEYWTSTNYVNKDEEGNVIRVWVVSYNVNDAKAKNCWGSDALMLLPVLTF